MNDLSPLPKAGPRWVVQSAEASHEQAAPMEPRWYVLRSKPHKEEALYHHGVAQGHKLFYPRIPVQRVNPRARPEAPYFPGYMFVHTNLAAVGTSAFEYMPHALGLVSFGGDPATVDEAIVEAIHQRVEEISAAGGETFLHLSPGDVIEITRGPFAGFEGIFDARLSGGDRVRVLLTLLSERTLSVELGASHIRRVA